MNNSLFSIANELESVAAMLCQLQLYTGRECRSYQVIAFVCNEIISVTNTDICVRSAAVHLSPFLSSYTFIIGCMEPNYTTLDKLIIISLSLHRAF
jgi:hypothetical protein